MKKKKTNPHCPVSGCKTAAPHADDPIVKGIIAQFSSPERMTEWTLAAMAELAESICRDLQGKRTFAWHTRLRQPEELYVRTLYALFIANEKERHHILSGDMPNDFSGLYDKVNEIVFKGEGLLRVNVSGLHYGAFRPIDTLNDGAHASFRAMITCIGLARDPDSLPSLEDYRKHLMTYCNYLRCMNEMFKAGKEGKHVLEAVVNWHRPKSYWDAEQKRIREEANAKSAAAPSLLVPP